MSLRSKCCGAKVIPREKLLGITDLEGQEMWGKKRHICLKIGCHRPCEVEEKKGRMNESIFD